MWTVGEDGEVTVAHFLLGIWSEKESAGHKIMAALSFDDAKAKEVAKFVSINVQFLGATWLVSSVIVDYNYDCWLRLWLCRWTRI